MIIRGLSLSSLSLMLFLFSNSIQVMCPLLLRHITFLPKQTFSYHHLLQHNSITTKLILQITIQVTQIAQLGDSKMLELLVVKLMTIGTLNVNDFCTIIQSSIVSSDSFLLVTKTTKYYLVNLNLHSRKQVPTLPFVEACLKPVQSTNRFSIEN